MPTEPDIGDRLLGLFADRICPEPNSGCWLWTGALNGSRSKLGYASARFENKPTKINSLIKKWRGFDCQAMRHTCGISICVNPDHLLPGTHLDNRRDIPAEERSAIIRKAWITRRRRRRG